MATYQYVECLSSLGQQEEAEQVIDRVLVEGDREAIRGNTSGSFHLMNLLTIKANILRSRGEVEETILLLEEAVTISQHGGGMWLVRIMSYLAETYETLGRSEDACYVSR